MREAMQAKGLNNAHLAELTGLTRSALTYFLQGKRQPSRPVLAEFADKLSVTVDYLLGGNDELDMDELVTNQRLAKLVALFKNLPFEDQERILNTMADMQTTGTSQDTPHAEQTSKDEPSEEQ